MAPGRPHVLVRGGVKDLTTAPTPRLRRTTPLKAAVLGHVAAASGFAGAGVVRRVLGTAVAARATGAGVVADGLAALAGLALGSRRTRGHRTLPSHGTTTRTNRDGARQERSRRSSIDGHPRSRHRANTTGLWNGSAQVACGRYGTIGSHRGCVQPLRQCVDPCRSCGEGGENTHHRSLTEHAPSAVRIARDDIGVRHSLHSLSRVGTCRSPSADPAS
jgi:hypothetical protein